MPTYETMFACRPDLSSEKARELTEKVKQFIVQNKGKVLTSENWGKKRLYCEVKGYREGNFSRIVFSVSPELIKNLEKNYHINNKSTQMKI